MSEEIQDEVDRALAVLRRNRIDVVEREYLTAIGRCTDSDSAYEISIGLKQYRELYKGSS